ncbi:hypothetical protein J1N35_014583 [Gossypium stocksii]|uniref:Uncharacterized protein n=1 Tax=Gossypium stocksii TaxID=47602 RepID=A0A9D3VV86_9ROSI|nr:hypothetical protein J1N35_014583 [Gossypium stocksii]
MKGGTQVLSIIQLAKDVPSGGNIDLVDRGVVKIPLELLEVRWTDMKPIESLMGLPPMREVVIQAGSRGSRLKQGRMLASKSGWILQMRCTIEQESSSKEMTKVEASVLKGGTT